MRRWRVDVEAMLANVWVLLICETDEILIMT